MSTAPVPIIRTGTYAIDPAHSRIGFIDRAMATKVRGSFNEFEGSGYLDTEDPANSKLALTIKAASIETHNAKRDAHLRSSAFLGTEAYPEITFVSTSVEQTSSEDYRVAGDLTIKGATRPIAIDFKYAGASVDMFGDHPIAFEGTTTVNRKDWGVKWSAALEAGGVLISEKVTLELAVSAVRTDGA